MTVAAIEAERPAVDLDLRTVSAAELLTLWRYRETTESGRSKGRIGDALTQPEAAARLGLGRTVYRRLEGGGRVSLDADRVRAIGATIASVEPTVGELCFLARHRSKRLLSSIERELGVSRPTFYEMERSGHPAVVRLWTRAGFAFP